jgi:hypothetical protein
MTSKIAATLSALAISVGTGLAQGPPSGFRNPQDAQPSSPPVIFEKHCSNCNRVVSSDSKTGDTCPFCGTKWVYDESPKAATPKAVNKKKTAEETPDTSIEKTIGRYAIVFAGLAVSALIVTLTIRFIMNNI